MHSLSLSFSTLLGGIPVSKLAPARICLCINFQKPPPDLKCITQNNFSEDPWAPTQPRPPEASPALLQIPPTCLNPGLTSPASPSLHLACPFSTPFSTVHKCVGDTGIPEQTHQPPWLLLPSHTHAFHGQVHPHPGSPYPSTARCLLSLFPGLQPGRPPALAIHQTPHTPHTPHILCQAPRLLPNRLLLPCAPPRSADQTPEPSPPPVPSKPILSLSQISPSMALVPLPSPARTITPRVKSM